MFVKYDILSLNIYLVWFAMLINEYKPEFYVRKVRKMRELGTVYICGFPRVMGITDEQNGLYIIVILQSNIMKLGVLVIKTPTV